MGDNLGTIDLLWIKSFLSRTVVHGSEQDALFAVIEKVNRILERTTNGTVGKPERSVA